MNFLAHLHLSGKYEQLLIGNFIADFLKGGIDRSHLSQEMLLGIKLHHAIDSFTDKHSIVRQGTQRLRKSYGKYAPVVIDVFYDHFLAHNWSLFHEQQLPSFAQEAYQILQNHHQYLPPKVQQILPYMKAQDWLSNYAKFYGIEQALQGLSRRASFQNNMSNGIADLKKHYEAFNSEFLDFYPEIILHIAPFWKEAAQLRP